jgi:4-amino-4-deoxy-L-arabinose transferase-like glycosyltransferase
VLAESTFITFFSLALATFYLGVKKKEKYLLLSGFFTGLATLTKYHGFYLLIIYLSYILLTKKFKIFKRSESFFAALIFLITLTPIFLIGLTYYHNPIGGILENMKIFSSSPEEPVYFYIINLFHIFNLPLIFILFGLFFSFKEMRDQDILFLISCIVPPFLLSLTSHKELRYFALFLPAFACMSGKGILNLLKFNEKYRRILFIISIIIFFSSFWQGCQDVVNGSAAGESLKFGALALKNLTRPEEIVMSESYPHVNYYAERIAIRPPPKKDEFYVLFDKYNITYVLVYIFERGNPSYLLQELNNSKNFEEVGYFYEWGKKATIIYKKVKL